VSIFRRNKDTAQDAAEDSTQEASQESLETAQPAETAEAAESIAPASAAPAGPWDASEVDLRDDGRLDLGALRIRGVADMELRLEVDEQAQQVVGATAVIADSAVQLQAFAAPRTMGVWDGIRSEIAESIVSQGGTADEVRGELGPELRTRMPSAGPDGRTVFAPARFVGVDGPRWFLRAVFSGRAAIDDDAAGPLMAVVRDTVVVRGESAMAPREMLPLRLPDEATMPSPEPAADDELRPFERGPEITEVR
jgi:hypothetical protein